MEKELYQNLLSVDPIGAFKKIKDDYVRYFKHGYKINIEALDQERIQKLRKDDNLYKEPFLEILPEYETASGVTAIDDLKDIFKGSFKEDGFSEQFFVQFIKAGLMNYPPYGHQVEMFRHAFCYKENVVITSGTGSGKTESFLLPLLAEIFNEAKSWEAPSYEKGADWFDGTKYSPVQRKGEKRKSAMRAMVLYPMNALVEDQMSRLRKALDSDKVRRYFDSEEGLKGNRIYFGRYTGQTIGNKSYKIIQEEAVRQQKNEILSDSEKRVAEELKTVYEKYANISTYYNKLSDEEKKKPNISDAPYVGTRLEKTNRTSEMVTRWDMQVTPPDIMITNTSMLSIMLMRSAEENIFAQTLEWLQESEEHIFHLIIDELHLYRGTSGSEVACLLRMLLHELGLDPIEDEYGKKHRNPQLRILASSASLGEPDATQKFLEEFFGVYNEDGTQAFYIQKGSDYRPENPGCELDYKKFKSITPEFVAKTEEGKAEMTSMLFNQYGCEDVDDFISKYEKQIFMDFISVLEKNPDGSLRPICYSKLFGKENSLFDCEDSLRGFLIFRGWIDKIQPKIQYKLPRFRFHQFFKYIEGMWGELKATNNGNEIPVGELSYVPQEIGPNKRKNLELLRCECCGELYIGGNKKVDGDDIYLSLNYPDLNRIPNLNPTPMVQNKSFAEYALFWPTNIGNINLESENEHVALLTDGETDFNKTFARAQWQHAYLNVYTGKISTDKKCDSANLIKGYLYGLRKDGNQPYDSTKIQAMPCCCPKCGQNYTNRKYAKSPVRSFRTGMDRTNQLLSKELIYQLSDEASKLIGFSDSREDAAKQAYGIEKEQYRDMVRMLFIQCINENNDPIDEIANYVKQRLEVGDDYDDIIDDLISKFPTCKIAPKIAKAVRKGESYAQYKSEIVELEPLVGKANSLDGALVQKLVKLGINPAGVDFEKQFYYETSDTNKLNPIHWSCAFDFDNGVIKTNTSGDYTNNVQESLKSAVLANAFGKYMGLSVLDSGIGYICGKRDESIKLSSEYQNLATILSPSGVNVYDFIDAYIRILGDNYRYDDPNVSITPSDISSYTAAGRLKKPIKHFAELHPNIDEAELGNALFDYLIKFISGIATKLIFNKLAFKRVHGSDIYYECPSCHRVHLNKGFGFCTNTNCMHEFDDTVIQGPVKNLWGHFISHDILVEPKKPRRLHTEELTGQTDNIQERLLEFKDLILLDSAQDLYRKGYELSKFIDMICVTTTMEVGVDIGSLEAIFQGNMSPTRYNYQQRVGRGGRRGQAFSTAVTCCRGRSHDVYYYYQATEEMVGAIPVAPTLSLAPFKDIDNSRNTIFKMKQSIMKRVIVKCIFREALRGNAFVYDLKDTAGEFGRVSDWSNTNRQIVKDWIISHDEEILKYIILYFGQFNSPQKDISKEIDDIHIWIKDVLLDEIDKIVEAYPNKTNGLAQCMSEYGFLPMYGLPSDIREFYHGYDSKSRQIKSIDRQLEVSIGEFAPGSEKTKDKGKYHVDGLTLPMNVGKDYKNNQSAKLNFISGLSDALSNRYTIHFEHDVTDNSTDNGILDITSDAMNNNALEVSQACLSSERLLVIPNAYRSWKIIGNQGRSIDNDERRSAFSQGLIYAKGANAEESLPKHIGNVLISTYGTNLKDESEVWHINTNNNLFFTGKYIPNLNPKTGTNDSESLGNFMFYDNTQNRIARENNTTLDIALGARKPTEMVKIQIVDTNPNVNINCTTGNRSAIRAAYYSAAYLIQRTLADKLDVQPEEIEISEKIIDGKIELYLSDALPNGAGLVSYLFDDNNFDNLLHEIVEYKTGFMKSLIDSKHRKECLTSCQKCLKTYTNRGFHHVLDWRLGVGLINLMLDSSYDFGFTDDTHSLYEELKDNEQIWVASAAKIGLSLTPNKIYSETKKGLLNYWHIISHPLWNKNAVCNKLNIPTNVRLKFYNTFKLLRSDISTDQYEQTQSTPASTDSESTQEGQTPQKRSKKKTTKNNSDEIVPGIDL